MTSTIARVLVWQSLVGVGLAAALWGTFDKVVAYSALLGSLTCVIPNAFLGLRLAASRREPGAKALLRAAWIGEIGKLALTVLMFTLVFTQVKPLSAAALFAGFIVTQLVAFTGLRTRHETDTKKSITNGS